MIIEKAHEAIFNKLKKEEKCKNTSQSDIRIFSGKPTIYCSLNRSINNKRTYKNFITEDFPDESKDDCFLRFSNYDGKYLLILSIYVPNKDSKLHKQKILNFRNIEITPGYLKTEIEAEYLEMKDKLTKAQNNLKEAQKGEFSLKDILIFCIALVVGLLIGTNFSVANEVLGEEVGEEESYQGGYEEYDY